MEQIPVNRRDIWIAKVPFSDLSSFKVRPIVILSKNSYNQKSEDVVGAPVTSNLECDFSIPIKPADFDGLGLDDQSAVRYDGLIKLEKSLLHKRIARVTEEFRKLLVKKIIEFID